MQIKNPELGLKRDVGSRYNHILLWVCDLTQLMKLLFNPKEFGFTRKSCFKSQSNVKT